MAVDKTKDIQVGGTLHSIATGNIIAHADEIMDEDYGKKQSVINQELNNRLTEELKGYLPLSGGIMSGNITFPNTLGILIQNKTNTDLLNAAGSTTTIASILDQVPKNVSEFNNDAKYQTEEQVAAKVASLVDSAPETLDTLNELAAALNDDPNFATTITNQLGNKLDSSTYYSLPASIVSAESAQITHNADSVSWIQEFYSRDGNGNYSEAVSSPTTKTINAATATTAGVLTAEGFKKLSNISLGDDNRINQIEFSASVIDKVSIYTEVGNYSTADNSLTNLVFEVRDDLATGGSTKDSIIFRSRSTYNQPDDEATVVDLLVVEEGQVKSLNPTTKRLERVANVSEIPSLDNYVTLDGAQNISGRKTFENILELGNNSYLFVNHNSSIGENDIINVGDDLDAKAHLALDIYIAANDNFRLYTGGPTDSGFTVLATGDNGVEPLYVAQYGGYQNSGSSKLINSLITLMDNDGNQKFNKVTATGFLISEKTTTDLLNAGGGTTSISNLAGQATLSGFSESTESNENLEIETTDTINQGFGKLQKAIKDNELTIAQALNAFKDNVGLLDLNASLPDMSSTHYMTNATTIVECLQALDSKLYEVEQALTLKTV